MPSPSPVPFTRWSEVEADPQFKSLTPDQKKQTFQSWQEDMFKRIEETPDAFAPSFFSSIKKLEKEKLPLYSGEPTARLEASAASDAVMREEEDRRKRLQDLEDKYARLKELENSPIATGDTVAEEEQLRAALPLDALERLQAAKIGDEDYAVVDGQFVASPKLSLDREKYRKAVDEAGLTREERLRALLDQSELRSRVGSALYDDLKDLDAQIEQGNADAGWASSWTASGFLEKFRNFEDIYKQKKGLRDPDLDAESKADIMEQWNKANDGWFSNIGTQAKIGGLKGAAGVIGSYYGLKRLLGYSPEESRAMAEAAGQLGQELQQASETIGGATLAAQAAEIAYGTAATMPAGPGGRIAAGIVRGTGDVAARAAFAATGRTLVPKAVKTAAGKVLDQVGMAAAVVATGAQSAGGAYNTMFDQYREQALRLAAAEAGVPVDQLTPDQIADAEESASSSARFQAYRTGFVEALFTALGGAAGAEAFAAGQAPDALREVVRDGVGKYLAKTVFKEFRQEGREELNIAVANGVLDLLTVNSDKLRDNPVEAIKDLAGQAFESYAWGGAMGAGMGGLKAAKDVIDAKIEAYRNPEIVRQIQAADAAAAAGMPNTAAALREAVRGQVDQTVNQRIQQQDDEQLRLTAEEQAALSSLETPSAEEAPAPTSRQATEYLRELKEQRDGLAQDQDPAEIDAEIDRVQAAIAERGPEAMVDVAAPEDAGAKSPAQGAGEGEVTPPVAVDIANQPSPNLAPRATENAPPRPVRQQGQDYREFQDQQDEWDNTYGRTHNEDGTPYQPTVLDETLTSASQALASSSLEERIDAVGTDIGAELGTGLTQLLNDGWVWDAQQRRMVDPQNRGESPRQALTRIRGGAAPAAQPAPGATPPPATEPTADENAKELKAQQDRLKYLRDTKLPEATTDADRAAVEAEVTQTEARIKELQTPALVAGSRRVAPAPAQTPETPAPQQPREKAPAVKSPRAEGQKPEAGGVPPVQGQPAVEAPAVQAQEGAAQRGRKGPAAVEVARKEAAATVEQAKKTPLLDKIKGALKRPVKKRAAPAAKAKAAPTKEETLRQQESSLVDSMIAESLKTGVLPTGKDFGDAITTLRKPRGGKGFDFSDTATLDEYKARLEAAWNEAYPAEDGKPDGFRVGGVEEATRANDYTPSEARPGETSEEAKARKDAKKNADKRGVYPVKKAPLTPAETEKVLSDKARSAFKSSAWYIQKGIDAVKEVLADVKGRWVAADPKRVALEAQLAVAEARKRAITEKYHKEYAKTKGEKLPEKVGRARKEVLEGFGTSPLREKMRKELGDSRVEVDIEHYKALLKSAPAQAPFYLGELFTTSEQKGTVLINDALRTSFPKTAVKNGVLYRVVPASGKKALAEADVFYSAMQLTDNLAEAKAHAKTSGGTVVAVKTDSAYKNGSHYILPSATYTIERGKGGMPTLTKTSTSRKSEGYVGFFTNRPDTTALQLNHGRIVIVPENLRGTDKVHPTIEYDPVTGVVQSVYHPELDARIEFPGDYTKAREYYLSTSAKSAEQNAQLQKLEIATGRSYGEVELSFEQAEKAYAQAEADLQVAKEGVAKANLLRSRAAKREAKAKLEEAKALLLKFRAAYYKQIPAMMREDYLESRSDAENYTAPETEEDQKAEDDLVQAILFNTEEKGKSRVLFEAEQNFLRAPLAKSFVGSDTALIERGVENLIRYKIRTGRLTEADIPKAHAVVAGLTKDVVSSLQSRLKNQRMGYVDSLHAVSLATGLTKLEVLQDARYAASIDLQLQEEALDAPLTQQERDAFGALFRSMNSGVSDNSRQSDIAKSPRVVREALALKDAGIPFSFTRENLIHYERGTPLTETEQTSLRGLLQPVFGDVLPGATSPVENLIKYPLAGRFVIELAEEIRNFLSGVESFDFAAVQQMPLNKLLRLAGGTRSRVVQTLVERSKAAIAGKIDRDVDTQVASINWLRAMLGRDPLGFQRSLTRRADEPVRELAPAELKREQTLEREGLARSLRDMKVSVTRQLGQAKESLQAAKDKRAKLDDLPMPPTPDVAAMLEASNTELARITERIARFTEALSSVDETLSDLIPTKWAEVGITEAEIATTRAAVERVMRESLQPPGTPAPGAWNAAYDLTGLTTSTTNGEADVKTPASSETEISRMREELTRIGLEDGATADDLRRAVNKLATTASGVAPRIKYLAQLLQNALEMSSITRVSVVNNANLTFDAEVIGDTLVVNLAGITPAGEGAASTNLYEVIARTALHSAAGRMTSPEVWGQLNESQQEALTALDRLREEAIAMEERTREVPETPEGEDGEKPKVRPRFFDELRSLPAFIDALFTNPNLTEFLAYRSDVATPGAKGLKRIFSQIARLLAQLFSGVKQQSGSAAHLAMLETSTLFGFKASSGAKMAADLKEIIADPAKYLPTAPITPMADVAAGNIITEAVEEARDRGFDPEAEDTGPFDLAALLSQTFPGGGLILGTPPTARGPEARLLPGETTVLSKERAFAGLREATWTVDRLSMVWEGNLSPAEAGPAILPAAVKRALEQINAKIDQLNNSPAENAEEVQGFIAELADMKALLELEIETYEQGIRAASPEITSEEIQSFVDGVLAQNMAELTAAFKERWGVLPGARPALTPEQTLQPETKATLASGQDLPDAEPPAPDPVPMTVDAETGEAVPVVVENPAALPSRDEIGQIVKAVFAEAGVVPVLVQSGHSSMYAQYGSDEVFVDVTELRADVATLLAVKGATKEQVKEALRAMIREELDHIEIAKRFSLPDIVLVADGMTDAEKAEVLRSYYGIDPSDPANAEEVKRLLGTAEGMTPQEVLQAKYSMAQEHLRRYRQRAATGFTTEEKQKMVGRPDSFVSRVMGYLRAMATRVSTRWKAYGDENALRAVMHINDFLDYFGEPPAGEIDPDGAGLYVAAAAGVQTPDDAEYRRLAEGGDSGNDNLIEQLRNTVMPGDTPATRETLAKAISDTWAMRNPQAAAKLRAQINARAVAAGVYAENGEPVMFYRGGTEAGQNRYPATSFWTPVKTVAEAYQKSAGYDLARNIGQERASSRNKEVLNALLGDGVADSVVQVSAYTVSRSLLSTAIPENEGGQVRDYYEMQLQGAKNRSENQTEGVKKVINALESFVKDDSATKARELLMAVKENTPELTLFNRNEGYYQTLDSLFGQQPAERVFRLFGKNPSFEDLFKLGAEKAISLTATAEDPAAYYSPFRSLRRVGLILGDKIKRTAQTGAITPQTVAEAQAEGYTAWWNDKAVGGAVLGADNRAPEVVPLGSITGSVKSLELVNLDSAGNVIPLSQRFDTSSPLIARAARPIGEGAMPTTAPITGPLKRTTAGAELLKILPDKLKTELASLEYWSRSQSADRKVAEEAVKAAGLDAASTPAELMDVSRGLRGLTGPQEALARTAILVKSNLLRKALADKLASSPTVDDARDLEDMDQHLLEMSRRELDARSKAGSMLQVWQQVNAIYNPALVARDYKKTFTDRAKEKLPGAEKLKGSLRKGTAAAAEKVMASSELPRKIAGAALRKLKLKESAGQAMFDFFADLEGLRGKLTEGTAEERALREKDIVAWVAEKLTDRVFKEFVTPPTTAAEEDYFKELRREVKAFVTSAYDVELRRLSPETRTPTPDSVAGLIYTVKHAEILSDAVDKARAKILAGTTLPADATEEQRAAYDRKLEAARNLTFDAILADRANTVIRRTFRMRKELSGAMDRSDVSLDMLTKMVAELGDLNPAQASAVTKALVKAYRDQAAAEAKRELDAYAKSKLTVTEKAEVERLSKSDRFLRFVRLGAFTDEEYYHALAQEFNLPSYDPAVVAALEKEALAVGDMPINSVQRQEAVRELNARLVRETISAVFKHYGSAALLPGRGVLSTYIRDIPMAMWKSAILSGFGTAEVNFAAGGLQSMMDLVTQSVAYGWQAKDPSLVATNFGLMLKQALTLGGAETWNEVMRAVTTGSTRFVSEQSENRLILDQNLPMPPGLKQINRFFKLVGHLVTTVDAAISVPSYIARQQMALAYALSQSGKTGAELRAALSEALTPDDQMIARVEAQLDTEQWQFDRLPRPDLIRESRRAQLLEAERIRRVQEIGGLEDHEDFIEAGRAGAQMANLSGRPRGVAGMFFDGVLGGMEKLTGGLSAPIATFTRSMANLMDFSLAWSIPTLPFWRAHNKSLSQALPDAAARWRRDRVEPGSVEYYKLMAQGFTALGLQFATVMMFLKGLADEEEGKVPLFMAYGEGYKDPEKNKQLRARQPRWFPNSVKIGPAYLSWKDIPGVNLLFGALAGVTDNILLNSTKDPQRIPALERGMVLAQGVVRAAFVKNGLTGLESAMDAVGRGAKGPEQFLRLLTSVPAGIANPRILTDVIQMGKGAASASGDYPVYDTRDLETSLTSLLPVNAAYIDKLGVPKMLNSRGEDITEHWYAPLVKRVMPAAASDTFDPIITPLASAGLFLAPPQDDELPVYVYENDSNSWAPEQASLKAFGGEAKNETIKAYGRMMTEILDRDGRLARLTQMANRSKEERVLAQEELTSISRSVKSALREQLQRDVADRKYAPHWQK